MKFVRKTIPCKKLSPTAKATLVYTFSGLVTRGLSIITVPIFTRIMTTAEIGTINVYNSWYSMLSVIATLALTSGGFMVAMKEYENQRDAYSSSILTLTSIMAVLMGLIYIISPTFWNHIFGLSTDLVFLMLLGLCVTPARDFWMSRQRYEIKYKSVALMSLGTAIIGTFFSVVCVLWAKGHGAENVDKIRLYANYLIVYGVSAIIFIYIFMKGKTLYNRRYWFFSLKLSVPLIGNSLANQVLSVSDRTMINNLIGKTEVGIYGTLYNVSMLSGIVWNAINSSFVPYMFQNMDTNKGRQKIRKYVNYILVGYALVALAMTLVAPEIVRFLATEEYYEAVYLMPPIAAGIFLISLGNLYSNVLLYYRKTQYIMIATIIAAAINVILNAILIPLLGYQIAAYTTLFAYCIMALIEAGIASYTVKRIMRIKEKFLYDNIFIFMISIILIILCLACNLIYTKVIIRWSVICSGVVFCLIFRKRIINFFKVIRS